MVRRGAAALQAARFAEARGLFEQVVAQSRGNIQIWLMLAYACRGMRDVVATEAAIDRALESDPNNIRALVIKGDCRRDAGDIRGSSRFHERALKIAEGQRLPADLGREIDRIRALAQETARTYRATLEGALDRSDVLRSRRFQHALDILFGEREVYQQQPKMFYFPELPQRQFYERDEFDWVEGIEAQTSAIIAELTELMRDQRDFRPYLVTDSNSPRREFHGLADNRNWSSLYLHENGYPVAANVARAQKSYAALQTAPLCHITTRAPTIMFSLLKAGAKIPPHTGMLNTRLICHLPLIVPPGCGFRVGNETRQWEVGKMLIFDDTMEHEAWNDSNDDRVVLIFDVWRPEITPDERAAIVAVFQAIDEFPG